MQLESSVDQMYRQNEVTLRSGDPHLIARRLSMSDIADHFGVDSFEYLAAEHVAAERHYRKRGLQGVDQPREYKIPRRTESPAATGALAKAWIREFCQANGLDLPRGFGKKTAKQARGMYFGMLRQYGISESDIVQVDPWMR